MTSANGKVETGAASEPTRKLATFLADARYDDLPPEVIDAAERAVLDWLGSVVAGSLEPAAEIARSVVYGLGVSDDSSVFPSGRSSAAGAALANGVASHILELDDIHKSSTVHGAAAVIPAALAVAEREGASGRRFLLAVVLGYEAALRVGEAVNPSHYRFWHPTGTAATFGAAAAAGSLLGLDANLMLDALGTAGTQAAGLWEFNADGAMSKHLHPGKAAFNGVISADLARLGFTGASRILEGDRGFLAAMSEGGDVNKITEELGTSWKIAENGYKLYPCCGHTHSAIDAALFIREEIEAISDPQAIARIEIRTYGPGFEIVKEMNPKTPYQAKFSLAYVVAAALAEGDVTLAQFSADRFGPNGVVDPAISRLLARTRVIVEPELTERYPAAWPNWVRIIGMNGRVHEWGANIPLGNAENPVPLELLALKAGGLIEPILGDDKATSMIESIPGIRELESMREWLPQFTDSTTRA